MKNNWLFLSLLLLTTVSGQSQTSPAGVDKLMFQQEKACTSTVLKGTFFKNRDRFFQDKFFHQQLISIKVTGECKDNRVSVIKNDTTLLLARTITTLAYRDAYASCAFDTIKAVSQRFSGLINSVWDFNKP